MPAAYASQKSKPEFEWTFSWISSEHYLSSPAHKKIQRKITHLLYSAHRTAVCFIWESRCLWRSELWLVVNEHPSIEQEKVCFLPTKLYAHTREDGWRQTYAHTNIVSDTTDENEKTSESYIHFPKSQKRRLTECGQPRHAACGQWPKVVSVRQSFR